MVATTGPTQHSSSEAGGPLGGQTPLKFQHLPERNAPPTSPRTWIRQPPEQHSTSRIPNLDVPKASRRFDRSQSDPSLLCDQVVENSDFLAVEEQCRGLAAHNDFDSIPPTRCSCSRLPRWCFELSANHRKNSVECVLPSPQESNGHVLKAG